MGEEGGRLGKGTRLVGRLGVEGGQGGGLESEGGSHLPPIAVGVEGGSGTPVPQLVVGTEEQGEMGLAVHGGEVVGGFTLTGQCDIWELTWFEPFFQMLTNIIWSRARTKNLDGPATADRCCHVVGEGGGV